MTTQGADPSDPVGGQRLPTRLLIVDDEPDVRASMQRVLERNGFAVRVAGGVAQALDELKRETVEVVITDIIMPKQTGADLIATLKKEYPGVQIVAISGGGNFWPRGYKPEAITTSAYLAAAARAGADGILAKPFETSELLEVIHAVLDKGGRAARLP